VSKKLPLTKSEKLTLSEKLRADADWAGQMAQVRHRLRWYVAPSDLEDAVNDTFLMFLENIEDFDEDRTRYETLEEKLGAFLNTLSRFTRLKYQRRQYRLKDLLQPLTEDPAGSSDEGLIPDDLPPLDADSIYELLSTALAGCGPALCDVADLHFQGLEPSQIAKELNLPPGTVYTRLRDLHTKLRAARGESTRKAVTHLVVRSRTTMTELLTGRRSEPLPLPGCGYEEEKSLETFEQTIDELPTLDDEDRLKLKQARRDLEELFERDAQDKSFICDTLIELAHELTREKPQPSLLERFMSNLAELAPSIAHLLSSLATLAQLLKK
jgi:DNA-directed RNA polymerase specialized sigma24 family protein